MNFKKMLLPLFGAFALIGCSKESVEPREPLHSESEPVTISLSLEGSAEGAQSLRAVSFDTNHDAPRTTNDALSSWKTHCFLSNEAGTKKAYAEIDWDATIVDGKVKLKMQGHTLTLKPIGSTSEDLEEANKPVAGERWTITGITGGGKLNADRTQVDFSSDEALDKDLKPYQVRMPFTFDKVSFTVAAEVGEAAPKVSVDFKPQGTLLNIKVSNKTRQARHAIDVDDSDLKVFSNALSNAGYYDYSTGEAKWVFTHEAAEEETISRSVSVAVDATQNYLLWGMPRPESAKPAEGFRSEISLGDFHIFAAGSNADAPKVRTQGYATAKAYHLGIDVNRWMMPIEHLVTTGAPDHRVKIVSGPTSNLTQIDPVATTATDPVYYTFDEAINALNKGILLDGRKYRMFTSGELASLFPGDDLKDTRAIHIGRYSLKDTGVKEIEAEEFTFVGESKPRRAKATYKADGTKTIYASRFENLPGRHCAYRYQFSGEYLTITCRYLGNQAVPAISDIATDAYWDNNNADDIKASFRMLGRKDYASGPVRMFGDYGFIWNSTEIPARVSGTPTSIYGRGVNFEPITSREQLGIPTGKIDGVSYNHKSWPCLISLTPRR